MTILKEDRLLGTDPVLRALAQELYEGVRDLPIISPHGHTDPRWFAENAAFADPAQLFVTPDHYVFRMLHSQGIPLEALGVPAPMAEKSSRTLAKYGGCSPKTTIYSVVPRRACGWITPFKRSLASMAVCPPTTLTTSMTRSTMR